MPALVDLVGHRFGRLTVLQRSNIRKYKKVFWECECDCGRLTTVTSTHLRTGNTRSCGCLFKEIKGEKSKNWKGDKAGYQAIHKWVRRHKPIPPNCEDCGKPTPPSNLYAHNISGKYCRDINDFIYLCPSCHQKDHANCSP